MSYEDKLELSTEKVLDPSRYLSKLGVFAIQKFVDVAHKEFDLIEGNWFRSTTFLMSLETIIEEEKERLADFNFKILNITENLVYLSDLSSKLYETKKIKFSDLSKETLERKFSNELDDSQNDDMMSIESFLSLLKTKPITNPLLFSLSTMLGLNEIDPIQKPFFKALMKLNSFLGILGGKEYKAYYFFGCDQDYFYYLDPHYVKESHSNDYMQENYIQDYCEKKVFKMKLRDISPSLSFTFLFETNKGNGINYRCY